MGRHQNYMGNKTLLSLRIIYIIDSILTGQIKEINGPQCAHPCSTCTHTNTHIHVMCATFVLTLLTTGVWRKGTVQHQHHPYIISARTIHLHHTHNNPTFHFQRASREQKNTPGFVWPKLYLHQWRWRHQFGVWTDPTWRSFPSKWSTKGRTKLAYQLFKTMSGFLKSKKCM